ncbi:MAG: hypothetical protein H6810_00325 [Phycisphaeraceae bacterium]|nr:MAG: hypothetical protein H6810_00325 [Phycisphaeraceae bacterium]
MKTALITLAAVASVAAAQQVESRAELLGILGDREYTEDFEGFSVHGGTVVVAPNPLNSDTAPAGWGILQGVSYSTPGTLKIYGGFLHGDDSNLLEATDDLLIEFDHPQAAVGFDIVNITGNVSWTDEVTFYHGASSLGTVSFPLPSASDTFAGWQDQAVGITSVRVSVTSGSQFGIPIADNVSWGLDVAACPADLAAPFGVLDLADITAFIDAFVHQDPLADIAPPAGVFDLADINLFVNTFIAGCP